MKLFLPVTLLMFAAPTAALADDLVIQLDGLRNAKGNVVICVWNNGEAFPDCDAGRPIARQSLDAATAAKTPITFKNIAPGTIAVSVFHDENANGKFDTNFVRMPLEGVGLSNNPKMFGPPKFKASTFMPKPGGTVRIKMSYL